MRKPINTILRLVKKIQKDKDRILVGIGGAGSSGKTTLALEIMKHFQKGEIGLLNLDGYYKDINYRRNRGWTGANPKSVNVGILKGHLKLIREGKSFEVPQDVVNKEQHLYEKTYQPKKINLIDGLSCMMDPFIEYYDVKIFITCPDDLQMERRMQRDAKVRKRNLDEIKQIFEHRNREFKQYILPNKNHADIVLDATKEGFKIVKSV